jgi:DNA ligase-1
MKNLKLLRLFVEDMNSSNSTNHKIEILHKYSESDFIKKILEYTYNPYKQYGLTSANLKKRQDLIAPAEVYNDLFSMLDDFNERNLTGHASIHAANRFIKDYEEYSDIIYQIIDRNLETRATTTLINRVFPNLIPEFNVALAHDASKVKGVDPLDGSWFASRKLDGIRCLTIIREGSVRFYSRSGKEFETLGKLRDDILSLGIDNIVLDGEICLMGLDQSDDFQGILKQIQKKDHTISNPKYWVFDILSLEEFESAKGSEPLSARIVRHVSQKIQQSDIMTLLPQIKISEESILLDLKNESKRMGWEGLILRRDVGYEGSRSKNMLKVKEFYDAEYQVKDLIIGPQRIIEAGAEVTEVVLSAIVIDHLGSRVQVGSGFSLAERRRFKDHPEEILGHTVNVQYFEETQDKDGNNSLRFPVFKAVYGKTREL